MAQADIRIEFWLFDRAWNKSQRELIASVASPALKIVGGGFWDDPTPDHETEGGGEWIELARAADASDHDFEKAVSAILGMAQKRRWTVKQYTRAE